MLLKTEPETRVEKSSSIHVCMHSTKKIEIAAARNFSSHPIQFLLHHRILQQKQYRSRLSETVSGIDLLPSLAGSPSRPKLPELAQVSCQSCSCCCCCRKLPRRTELQASKAGWLGLACLQLLYSTIAQLVQSIEWGYIHTHTYFILMPMQ